MKYMVRLINRHSYTCDPIGEPYVLIYDAVSIDQARMMAECDTLSDDDYGEVLNVIQLDEQDEPEPEREPDVFNPTLRQLIEHYAYEQRALMDSE